MTATITISSDTLSYGPAATREDVTSLAANLADLLEREFPATCTVTTGLVSSPKVTCSDVDLGARIEQRVRDIVASDEWTTLLP